MPVVYAMTQSLDSDEPAILPDDIGGGRVAAEHLLALGRRRFGHITGPERFLCARKRARGFCDTVAAAGVGFGPSDVLYGEWSEAWGREAAALLLADSPDVDAIFCGNDQIARGVADALRERGLGVPDAVSLVGFDNWEIIADATRPPLTSIDMNLVELGREGGRRMLDLIAGRNWQGVERLPCSLIVRQSCGAKRILTG